MPTLDPRVDAYIAKARPFAQPVLQHLRTLVHKACPACVETIKWGFPHFDHQGGLCSMAAFKAHCVFGFWKAELLADTEQALELRDRQAMGHFGRIGSLDDLPSNRAIVALVQQAARLNEAGVKVPRAMTRKAPLRVPAYFSKAMAGSPKASAAFKALAPSHQREYVEWVTEAKTDATREKRLATTVQWLAEGKRRNWKYEPAKASDAKASAAKAKPGSRNPATTRTPTAKRALKPASTRTRRSGA